MGFQTEGEEHRQRAGAEVVQLYVHDGHSKIDRPVT